jgi:hypothetical protein
MSADLAALLDSLRKRAAVATDEHVIVITANEIKMLLAALLPEASDG